MVIIAVLAAMLAALSPLWGLIFTISFSGKYLNRLNLFLLIFVLSAVALVLAQIIDVIAFADVLVGVGLCIFVYLYYMQKTESYILAILSAALVNLIYALLRQVLWSKKLAENMQLVMQNAEQLIRSSLAESQEQLPMALELLETSRNILTKYYIGTWMITIILGLYFGSILLSRQIHLKFNHQRLSFPFTLIYLLIGGLMLFVLPQMRIYGINILMILGPLFIIQGISILDFFWRDFFLKSKFLLFLLIVAMAFNIPILILVALIGMLDIWFDFRKIRIMEEFDESHSS